MKTKTPEMPKVKTESEEADWWASPQGRTYIKTKSAGTKVRGSSLVAKMNQKSSEQISLRLPRADLARARELAERRGLGYQTLLKMLVHEGLAREARRG